LTQDSLLLDGIYVIGSEMKKSWRLDNLLLDSSFATGSARTSSRSARKRTWRRELPRMKSSTQDNLLLDGICVIGSEVKKN